MATPKKISQLTALSGADLADGDYIPVVDVSATETKRMTRAELLTGLESLTDIDHAKTLFVDLTYGAASGERGNANAPFSTYALALAAWTPGDTIHLRPGNYTAALAMPAYSRTIAAASSGLVRSSNTVTCTVTASHAIPVGCRVLVSDADNSTFDGIFTVLTVTSTTMTWSQSGSDASSGGGTICAAGYLHMEDGAVVNVSSSGSSSGALYSTAKTFTVVTGSGEFVNRGGYGVNLRANDSRLEIACREIVALATAAPGLHAYGVRNTVVAQVSSRIYSRRYDGVWIDGAARAFVRSRVIEGGDQAVELTTIRGCHVEAEEFIVVGDNYPTFGLLEQPAMGLTKPNTGEQHVVRGNRVTYTSTGDAKGYGVGVAVFTNNADDGDEIVADNGGEVVYDVRETVTSGGPAIWLQGSGSGRIRFANGSFTSSFSGTAVNASREGFGVVCLHTDNAYFDGVCHLFAATNAATSTYATSAKTLYGTIRANKAGDADVTVTDFAASGTRTLSDLAASSITSGTIATARLGSGTADSSTFLRGDQTWATVSGGASALDDLSDVAISGAASGNVLYHNGTQFVNAAPNTAGLIHTSGGQTIGGTLETSDDLYVANNKGLRGRTSGGSHQYIIYINASDGTLIGENGAIRIADGAPSDAIVVSAAGAVTMGGSFPVPVFVRSTYWSPSPFINDGAPSGVAWPIINRAYVTPFYLIPGTVITALAINVSAAGTAGNVVRIGLFGDSSGAPGTLVEQSTVAGDSTGLKTYTLASAYTVGATGRFWVASAPQGASSPGSTWMGASVPHRGPTMDNGASWAGNYGMAAGYFASSGEFSSSPSLTYELQARVPYIVARVQ